MTENDAVTTYKYSMECIASNNSLPNGISLNDFAAEYFFKSFDLSSSQEANLVGVLPAARGGLKKLVVKFSTNTSVNLTMLVMREHVEIMEIKRGSPHKITVTENHVTAQP